MEFMTVSDIPAFVNTDDTCGNPYRLYPALSKDGEVWLKADGNGMSDDIMLESVDGMPREEIVEKFGQLDVDAMREFADELRETDPDAADWLVNWCDAVSSAVSGETQRA